jgi:hypothetical protein
MTGSDWQRVNGNFYTGRGISEHEGLGGLDCRGRIVWREPTVKTTQNATRSQAQQTTSGETQSFGETNFGHAQLGDKRRTKRLVSLADTFVRHPGGSLPDKVRNPGELEALYHLMKSDAVTHESILTPHQQLTLQKMADHNGWVLVLHDTTELDFTKHKSLTDAGQIGNGSRTGWLCHNSLVVCPQRREVMGLANQILHRRTKVSKKETQAKRRARKNRESRLWLKGTEPLPADRNVVDVCDRGADTFEFLEHACDSGRTFVVRSSHNRSIFTSHDETADGSLLHTFARTLPALGEWTLEVAAATLEKKPKKSGKSKVIKRKQRDAVLNVSAAPIQLCAPSSKNGQHGNDPLAMWIVRVWEPNPPEGVEPLEWFLLTNHPTDTFESAWDVVSWYECRWIIEEYHKAQKTGCGIENPQFNSSDRLHPMIALLSVVAISLLNLRDLSRRADAKDRPAIDVISRDYISLLSQWRHGEVRADWTIHDFCFALARLGGHLNRTHDNHPGWIVLWRGWTYLQKMIDGASIGKSLDICA